MIAQQYIKMNKKAQIHMTETLIVLMIFFIILFFGIFLYYNYTFKDIKESGQEVQEKQAQAQLQIISSMPEFSCADFSCIDTLKLIAFQQNTQHYQNTFGFKTIEIMQIYPRQNEIQCTTQTYPDCNKYAIYNNPKPDYKSKLDSSIPVSLYFPSKNQYKIGKIIITNYE